MHNHYINNYKFVQLLIMIYEYKNIYTNFIFRCYNLIEQ